MGEWEVGYRRSATGLRRYRGLACVAGGFFERFGERLLPSSVWRPVERYLHMTSDAEREGSSFSGELEDGSRL